MVRWVIANPSNAFVAAMMGRFELASRTARRVRISSTFISTASLRLFKFKHQPGIPFAPAAVKSAFRVPHKTA
jgi:hypothetical protein